MSEPVKISFGFSKISKKPVVTAPKKDKNEIQFIDCLEGNAIKLINGEEDVKKELVIPLKNGNILRDNMIEALKSRKEENDSKPDIIKEEIGIEKAPDNGKQVECENKPLTLDELAAKEILEDLKKSNEADTVKDTLEIPSSNVAVYAQKESTLEDYESIPVNEFGLAMLRGMGWAPEKGVGKNGQVVQVSNPVLRPKGMGLGADKAMPTVVRSVSGEELVMKKTAMLKVTSGPYKGLYGKVEGFDELPGRIMVRLTLQNNVISISENLVQLVTSEEYNKNSKILNLSDYNNYYEEKNISKNESITVKKEFDKGNHRNIKVEPNNSGDEVPSRSKMRDFNSIPIKQEKRSSSSSPEPIKIKSKEVSGRKWGRDEDRGRGETRTAQTKTYNKHRDYRRLSEQEESYKRYKSKKDNRAQSPDSDYELKKSKSKSKRRDSSLSSDDERYKGKKHVKDERKGHSSYSKKISTHKIRESSNSASDGEEKRKISKSKHRRRERSCSSDSNMEERKKKTYYKNRDSSFCDSERECDKRVSKNKEKRGKGDSSDSDVQEKKKKKHHKKRDSSSSDSDRTERKKVSKSKHRRRERSNSSEPDVRYRREAKRARSRSRTRKEKKHHRRRS